MRYGRASELPVFISARLPQSGDDSVETFYIRRGTFGDFRLGGSLLVIREISQALAVTFSRPKIWVK